MHKWNTITHDIFLKHSQNTHKHPWNIIDTSINTLERPLKIPWKILKKNLENTSERSLKHHWKTLKNSLKYPWVTPEIISTNHIWNTIETPPWTIPKEHCSNTLNTLFKYHRTNNNLETTLKHTWNTFETPLRP